MIINKVFIYTTDVGNFCATELAHTSIFHTCFTLIRVVGGLEPIPTPIRGRIHPGRVVSLFRGQHRDRHTTMHTQIHFCCQFRVTNQPKMHVFKMEKKPMHAWREQQTSHRKASDGIQTGDLLVVRWQCWPPHHNAAPRACISQNDSNFCYEI